MHAVINAVLGRSGVWRRWEAKSSWSTDSLSTGCSAKRFASSCSAYVLPNRTHGTLHGAATKYNNERGFLKLHLAGPSLLCATLGIVRTHSDERSTTRPPRLELAADSGWKFVLGDPSGAEAPSFADTAWRTVDLPHDWSIEGRPDKNNPTGAGGGFFPAGIGLVSQDVQRSC